MITYVWDKPLRGLTKQDYEAPNSMGGSSRYKDTYVCGIVGFIICILVGTRTGFVSPRSRCGSVFFSCALDLDPWYIPNTKSYKLNMLKDIDILCSYHDKHRPSFPRHGLFMASGRFVLIVGPVYEPAFYWEGPTLFPCSFLLLEQAGFLPDFSEILLQFW